MRGWKVRAVTGRQDGRVGLAGRGSGVRTGWEAGLGEQSGPEKVLLGSNRGRGKRIRR